MICMTLNISIGYLLYGTLNIDYISRFVLYRVLDQFCVLYM